MKFVKIGQVVSEKSFEILDGRTDDRRRTDDGRQSLSIL